MVSLHKIYILKSYNYIYDIYINYYQPNDEKCVAQYTFFQTHLLLGNFGDIVTIVAFISTIENFFFLIFSIATTHFNTHHVNRFRSPIVNIIRGSRALQSKSSKSELKRELKEAKSSHVKGLLAPAGRLFASMLSMKAARFPP